MAAEDRDQPARRLVSWTEEVAIEPLALLARAPGQARTFWQHEGLALATVGALTTIEVPPAAHRGNGHGRDRFAVVRDEAARLAEAHTSRAEDGRPRRLRFHGGLSFQQDHMATAPWEAFPVAWFSVPAIELESGPTGAELTVRAAVDPGASRREGERAVRRAFDATLDALAREAPPRATEHPEYGLTGKTPIAAWDAAVDEALGRIAKGELSKVVLSRQLAYTLPRRPDPVVVLANLRQDNPGTSLFLVEPRPGAAFLGAAPERIGAVRGAIFQATAVAGSAPRGVTPADDDALARELTVSVKDRSEHTIVVDSMRRRLTAIADHVELGGATHVLRLTRIQHLETELLARLRRGAHVLDVVEALHPTPAVCGSPREPAQRFLAQAEPFDRGWYAGPVGWFDEAGDGCFAPGLRSAVLDGDTWTLYAGAGIVDGSVSAKEWDETAIKFEPVLRALGIGQAP